MEITPMEKTSDQIQGLSKCYLGITYYLSTPKTVATGHEKSVTADGPLKLTCFSASSLGWVAVRLDRSSDPA